MTINFAEPVWLWILAASLPISGILIWWNLRRSRRLLSAFAADSMISRLTASFSSQRHLAKSILAASACLLLMLAAARPQWGVEVEEIELRGIDMMFALDVSRSMLAEDYTPNRLERAKLAITDLVSRLRGDRVGLIAFARVAYLQCPLTNDYDAFLQTLRTMDTDTIPVPGTDIAAAIEESIAYYEDTDHHRVLILVSDGEDLEARAVQLAREAADRGITIFTVGIGNPEGELIPVRQADGSIEFHRDAAGNIVQTRLDEETLQQIAAAGNGIYQHLGRNAFALDEIHQAARAIVDDDAFGSLQQETPIERYHWPLALALLCFVADWILHTRRKRSGATSLRAGSLAMVCGLVFLLHHNGLNASPGQAERMYRSGEYAEALRLWQESLERRPDDARVLYNIGNSHYRLRQFDDAIDAFEQALGIADVRLQERIFFNLANAQYQKGVEAMVESPESTMSLWEDALKNYDNSMALNPDAQDAATNRQWVERQFIHHGARIEVAPNPPYGGRTSSGGLFLPGIILPLEAEPNENWRFSHWHGAEVAEPESAETELIVRESARVEAIFIETRRLEVITADPDQGTAKESGRYDRDADVPIEAEANDYYVFKEWTSDTLTIANPAAAQTTVRLEDDGSVTAHFTDAYKLEVISQPPIAGNVGTTGFYERQSDVPIHAEARDGFEWIGWIGDNIADTSSPQSQVSLQHDSRAVAHFDRIWNLIVLPDSDEAGSTTGGGNFPVGNRQPIEAVANEGYTFRRWDGPGVDDPEAASTYVTVQPDEHTVIAVFEEDESDDQDDQDSGDGDSSDDDSDGDSPPEDSESDGQDSDDPQEDDSSAEPEPDQTPEPEEEPARETPESLTEEEARQLLQMLRQDERQLPLRVQPPDEELPSTGRDW